MRVKFTKQIFHMQDFHLSVFENVFNYTVKPVGFLMTIFQMND